MIVHYRATKAQDDLYDLKKTEIEDVPPAFTVARDHFSVVISATMQAIHWALVYGESILETIDEPRGWCVYRRDVKEIV